MNATRIEHQLSKVNMIQCIPKVHTAAFSKSAHSRSTVIQASAAVRCDSEPKQLVKVVSKHPPSARNEEEESKAERG